MYQTIAAFLLAAAWPIVKKVLMSLGIGFLTYEGLSLVAGQLKDSVLAQWAHLDGATLQLLSLAGIPEAVGIILGAISAKAALMAVGRIGKVSA